MAYVRKDYPERSWSNSRRKIFIECPRKYYEQYYRSHNGWEDTSPIESKDAYMYKKLENIYSLIGNLLHQEFSKVIQQIQNNDEHLLYTANDIKTAVVQKSREVIRKDKRNETKEEFKQKPSKVTMLQEYFIGNGITTEEGQRIKEKIEYCADNFFECSTYDILGANPGLEIIENDNKAYDTYLLIDGIKVYFRVDLLYKDTNTDKYYIVDWKTGGYNEEDKEQLLMYAYYVYAKYGVRPCKINAKIEYLMDNTPYESDPFTQDDMQYAEELIIKSIKDMDQLLEDVSMNKPKEVKYFPQIETSGICKLCNYRRLCAR